MNNGRGTTLQDMPLEMLDMILMKSVLLALFDWMKAESAHKYLLSRVIVPLRNVGSQWNYRLTTRWFKIVLKRHLKNLIVNLRFVKKLSTTPHLGHVISKLDDSICVLCCDVKLIRVYQDRSPFHLLEDIQIQEIESPCSIAYCNILRSLFVTDRGKKCVWKISKEDHQASLWLSDISNPFTLSFSTCDGRLLMLRDSEPVKQLEVYGLDAVLVRCVPVCSDFEMPLHAVQRSNGNFIISHFKKTGSGQGCWVISQLTSYGHVISQFNPRDKLQELNYPRHLCVDYDSDRLFVSDYGNNRVILFDLKHFAWRQILLTKEDDGIQLPRICYDVANQQLIVGNLNGEIDIYALNSIESCLRNALQTS